MTTAKSKNGVVRRLLYNENFLLVDPEDQLSFSISDNQLELELVFNLFFSDEGDDLKTTGDLSDDGKVLNMTLHKWNSSLGTEVTKPLELTTNKGKLIWIKFRTTADKKNSFRSFHLTIWGEE